MVRKFSIVCLLACLLVQCCAVLVGRLRDKEEPVSNWVPATRFLYPEEDPNPCKTDQGDPGLCVDVRRCYAARRALRAGSRPRRCGWSNMHVPLVCCHPDQVLRRKWTFGRSRSRYGRPVQSDARAYPW
ncbi:uncharacterized protein LOC129229824 [Uloborus diversus]|uniref:uncharacterized protein LOC129229824 n=1 Tax=Uloborus diversus TaxID=327109 RepID=UPI00240965D0|nr:uncharacterized protein LOC129229824 [Uloborus diversus]